MLTTSALALAGLAGGLLFHAVRLPAAQSQRTAGTQLSGPYTHENLTIFLIHGPNQTAKRLLTLEEAMDQHKVFVYETRSVNELAIENVSDEDVFIESGDIVKGGAQDRTLKDDLILPSKSGKVNLNAFCVEHGRWSRRGTEAVGTFGGSRDAWNRVAEAQAQLSNNLRADVRAAASPTSYAMTMDAPVVQRSTDGYLQELAGIVNGKNDVIGFAFAIDGKLNSVDVYGSHELFAKLWMKLLRASCVEAVTAHQTGTSFAPVTAPIVKAAMADAESGKELPAIVNDRTEVVKKETTQNVMFETRDRGQSMAWVHRNYMTK
jgi:hypothetical protein